MNHRSKYFKRFLFGFLGVLGAYLAVSNIVVPHFVHKFGPQIPKEFEVSGHQVKLEDYSISWGGIVHPLSLSLSNVVVSSKRQEDLKFSVRRAIVSLKSGTILSGKFKLAKVYVKGAKVMHPALSEADISAVLIHKPYGGRVTVEFKNLDAIELARHVPELLAGNTISAHETKEGLPLSGLIAARYSNQTGLTSIKGEVVSKSGAINIPSLYPTPLAVTDIHLGFKGNAQGLEVTNLSAQREMAHVDASVSIIPSVTWAQLWKQGGEVKVAVFGKGFEVPFDDLNNTWPISLTPTPRKWVTTHITKGIAHSAGIKCLAILKMDPKGEVADFKLPTVSGYINVTGGRVTYYGDLPAVEDAKAKIHFTKQDFAIDVTGHANGVRLVKGDILISKLDQPRQEIQLNLNLEGSSTNTLEIIEYKPLDFPKKLGLDPRKVRGAAKTNVLLKFPLRTDLPQEMIEVTAKAKMTDCGMSFDVANKQKVNVTGGTFNLIANKEKMLLSGNSLVNDFPAQVTWEEWFDVPNRPFHRKYSAQADLTMQQLQGFGLPKTDLLDGKTRVELVYTDSSDEVKGLVELKANLKDMAIELPMFGWSKSKGTPGRLTVKINTQDEVPMGIRAVSLVSKDLDVKLTGSLDCFEGHNMRIGAHNLGLRCVNSPNGKMDLAITATRLNVSPILDYLESMEGDSSYLSDRQVKLSLNAQELKFKKGKLKGAKGAFYLDKGALTHATLTAKNKKGKRTKLSIGPKVGGIRQVNVHAKGAAWLAEECNTGLDIRDGDLTAEFKCRDLKSGGTEIKGNVHFQNVVFGKAPLSTRLLTIASPQGIASFFSGKGAHFSQGDIKLVSTPKKVKFDKIRFTGPMLALACKGEIDRKKNTINLVGEASPMYMVNSAIAHVPLIGHLLSAGNRDGVFCTPFSIVGTCDNPDVKSVGVATFLPRIMQKAMVGARK